MYTDSETSKKSNPQMSLFPTFGEADFRVRTSHWREWASAQGLKGPDLDSFSTLLDSLVKDAPELFYSKTFMVSCIPTRVETSKPSFELWPSSGILSDGVCLTAKTLESPNRVNASTLSGVIETGRVPQKYFLKPN